MQVGLLPGFGERPTRTTFLDAHPHPDGMTLQDIGLMAAYAYQAVPTQPVAEAAQTIFGVWPKGSRRQRAQTIFRYLQQRVAFARDENLLRSVGIDQEELLIRPERLLTMPEPKGDCDDFSMAAAALLLRAGVPVEFVTIAADAKEPGRFSHVYVQAVLEDGSRFPLDVSHGPYPGWERPNAYRHQVWSSFGQPVEGSSLC